MTVKSVFFYHDFRQLVNACVSYHYENKNKKSLESVHVKRAELSGFAEAFHRDCGTLTPSVEKRIEDLRSGLCAVLMTAHQPNLFAYSGVFRKATLNFVLAKELEEKLEVPVVNFFGIADQDFTDDRWVRSCQLPAAQRSKGILPLEAKLPEKSMLNKMAKPTRKLLDHWKNELENWLNAAIRSADRLCHEQRVPLVSASGSVTRLQENLETFWSVVEDCFERAKSYADFNAFFLSSIVNKVWGYDTVFSRFSECQQALVDEFEFLLARSEDYARLLKEAKENLHTTDAGDDVSDQEPWLAPFWYHCDCGSKARLFMTGKDGLLGGQGNCMKCGEYYALDFGAKNSPDISRMASRISARAIAMSLVFFRGLIPVGYVGGAGGARYLLEAEHVAKGLGIPFPPAAVWRPHDRYLGVGQLEAVLELRRIYTDLGVSDVCAAKELLEARLSEIRGRLDTLEEAKQGILEKLRAHPNDEKLREEIKRISISRTEMVKSSELSVVSHELKLLVNSSTALDLIPSIIDYAVNVGLEETNSQWIRHLDENSSLRSDVRLESVLSNVVDLDANFPTTKR